jgi:hypothetical protein
MRKTFIDFENKSKDENKKLCEKLFQSQNQCNLSEKKIKDNVDEIENLQQTMRNLTRVIDKWKSEMKEFKENILSEKLFEEELQLIKNPEEMLQSFQSLFLKEFYKMSLSKVKQN